MAVFLAASVIASVQDAAYAEATCKPWLGVADSVCGYSNARNHSVYGTHWWTASDFRNDPTVDCFWFNAKGKSATGGWHVVQQKTAPPDIIMCTNAGFKGDTSGNYPNGIAWDVMMGHYLGNNTWECTDSTASCFGVTRHRFEDIGGPGSRDFYTSDTGTTSTPGCWSGAGGC